MLHFAFTKNGRSLSKRMHGIICDHPEIDPPSPSLYSFAVESRSASHYCNSSVIRFVLQVNQSFRKFILDILAMKSRRLSRTLSRLPSRGTVTHLLTRLPGTVDRLRNRYSAVPAAGVIRETENSETGAVRI
eukprot:sb/3474958/